MCESRLMELLQITHNANVHIPIISSLLLSAVTFLCLLFKSYLSKKLDNSFWNKLAPIICAAAALSHFLSHSSEYLGGFEQDIEVEKPVEANYASPSYPSVETSPNFWTLTRYLPVAMGSLGAFVIFYLLKIAHKHGSHHQNLLECGVLFSFGKSESTGNSTFFNMMPISGFEALAFHKIMETMAVSGGISEAKIFYQLIYSLLPFFCVTSTLIACKVLKCDSISNEYMSKVLNALSIGFFGFIAYDLTLDALSGGHHCHCHGHGHGHGSLTKYPLVKCITSCYMLAQFICLVLIVRYSDYISDSLAKYNDGKTTISIFGKERRLYLLAVFAIGLLDLVFFSMLILYVLIKKIPKAGFSSDLFGGKPMRLAALVLFTTLGCAISNAIHNVLPSSGDGKKPCCGKHHKH
ncbi:hypothetical protein DI09_56p20 [Mitosporidium daphniae]|uniref:Uncharacterized protein n=1 Tax=Mitosporidium daphniae TaxID=1485682 RepID=A0A098VPM4_9MICR|nr:uncharacterized protein DI09_56p20 [Mitosporidium daphniae]KGG50764.1 hypothetical protein DI09_56p20 [Mitosporidium daphniae]|eukprot:XP_013237208.1 uncharacterized protein DI09_56p20 [Mitosporidium daphniae]